MVAEFTDTLYNDLSDRLRGVSLDSLKLIGLHVTLAGDIRTIEQLFEARVGNQWILVDVASRASRLYRFTLRGDTISLAERNAFSNASFGVSHLVVLLWSLTALAAACVAAARTLRSRMRHRWLWAVLSFVVVVDIDLNWTTGATNVRPLFFSFVPISWVRAGPSASWVLGTGVPLFAMIALRRARRWESEPEPDPSAQDPSDVGEWSVMRSTPEGGELRIATHFSRQLAESHAEQLRSAGLEHRYWIQGPASHA